MWVSIIEDIARSFRSMFHEPEQKFCVDWLVVGSVAS